ncbi:hypothetical protein SAMD00019534_033010 [Acytostelium subglobosum LB1]|uniref:hypothetical protein n=1 Tax=Acytostelium subglobosum LB1 TaxID=1410327 RepID=UPI00064506F9|nr:hypothetical protein SAMD00019534_033010 [Acytostelium subglobosum LB1]GAM20126.1 hypothetical protein SAMD00019534_033010 [Acytostelium subglobosum LB1]|eukprot:XP_012756888.1 hypothetical protein SAMD00019534_033010 [Acytostelium subglobosum LB1]
MRDFLLPDAMDLSSSSDDTTNTNTNTNSNSSSIVNTHQQPFSATSPTLSQSSSEDDSSLSPTLAKSFLSPLNFTTCPSSTRSPNKKNQSYSVSTYYSSCEMPDMSESSDDQSNNTLQVASTTPKIPQPKKHKSCILPQFLQLRWNHAPKKVLVIHKNLDVNVLAATKPLIQFLSELNITTYLEKENLSSCPTAQSLSDIKDPSFIDFIICLGGDGTILHTSSLFRTFMPPILPFNMGSLGFLTSFDYPSYKENIRAVVEGKYYVSYRLRIQANVISSRGVPGPTNQVLNEVTIDRGNNPYLSNLECSCDDKLITIVQADGLIIATSTGSTAYSLSAGGSLVHPTLPAVLITPICPHTLSFRPIILPSTSTLVIRVSETSRCTAWCSFDGKNRQELHQGDSVVIKTSKWAVPVICKTNESNEWFEKLAKNLNWNVRSVQKSFNP